MSSPPAAGCHGECRRAASAPRAAEAGHGNPAVHARVAFEANAGSPAEGLAGFAAGNITVTTDTNGVYAITGAAEPLLNSRGKPLIRATTWDDRASLPAIAPEQDGTMDITVVPTGSIDVVVTGSRPTLVIARAVGAGGAALVPRAVDGRYRLDGVPAGEYEIRAGGVGQNNIASARATVVAGTMVTATLALAKLVPVSVEVRWGFGSCKTIKFDDDSLAVIASAACTGDTAHVDALDPGTYIVCVETQWTSAGCTLLEVAETPALQHFDIPRK